MPTASGASAARHQACTSPPDRARTEIDAKRRLLDCLIDAGGEICGTFVYTMGSISAEYFVKMLALPYADRPGYRDEWRP